MSLTVRGLIAALVGGLFVLADSRWGLGLADATRGAAEALTAGGLGLMLYGLQRRLPRGGYAGRGGPVAYDCQRDGVKLPGGPTEGPPVTYSQEEPRDERR